jgi:hypothetical protein
MWSASLVLCHDIFFWYFNTFPHLFPLSKQYKTVANQVAFTGNWLYLLSTSHVLQWVSPFGMSPVVSWLFYGHLPLDFSVRFFLLVSFTLSLEFHVLFSLFSPFLSQPPSYMQVSEHLTWKLVWTHFVRSFVQFGAITVSCSLWPVSKPVLVHIFESGAFIFFACVSKNVLLLLLH